jgi:hypothetical protein
MTLQMAQQLVGAWQGKTTGNRSLSCTFYSDGRVQFLGEPGRWEVESLPSPNLAKLIMTFVRREVSFRTLFGEMRFH